MNKNLVSVKNYFCASLVFNDKHENKQNKRCFDNICLIRKDRSLQHVAQGGGAKHSAILLDRPVGENHSLHGYSLVITCPSCFKDCKIRVFVHNYALILHYAQGMGRDTPRWC